MTSNSTLHYPRFHHSTPRLTSIFNTLILLVFVRMTMVLFGGVQQLWRVAPDHRAPDTYHARARARAHTHTH